MFQILVVEDNKSLLMLMKTRLQQAGYNVLQAQNGQEALEILEDQQVDLMISDIMMPLMDGFELIESLREANFNLPILMVTAKEGFEDKEKGFRLGTDDYMVKPIDMNEMILRVAALLRRAKITNEHKLVIGEIVLDYDNLSINGLDIQIELPKKEFLLLFKLLSYPKRIFTRQQLMSEIWGLDTDIDERTVDSHIKKLRKKFEDRPEFKIITIRGLGYKAEKIHD
ncbi:response regulator transcription factor [Desulfosporosinus sp. BICA1-9]|uniref:response regulator transcription factor n=1 Tax=Desulfosporosinus sp. BICA1-9 TaxID=1531958 RepID=UPI00054B88F2|nr:response regulator transcription factor [Desulfosporosinus sp. BICA1-9]KJS85421.1 MAG: heme response regulator HssR [Desulfosporosinus sp. BICA1-9]HBW38695.1 DNA-binding response regulator [Desulfosporosinus sp.]